MHPRSQRALASRNARISLFFLAVRDAAVAKSTPPMWFDVEPADMSFTQSSPHQLSNEAVIDATPERVFEIFATAERQRDWFKDFVACRWTSAAPQGAGSTREITLKTLSVKERFLVWEPGKRLSFCIYASTMPLMKRMIEDMQMEPTGSDASQTRLRWTVHYEPTLPMRLVHPVARVVFGGMFRESTEGLRRYASDHR